MGTLCFLPQVDALTHISKLTAALEKTCNCTNESDAPLTVGNLVCSPFLLPLIRLEGYDLASLQLPVFTLDFVLLFVPLMPVSLSWLSRVTRVNT
jgi:hypothetical protein